MDSKDANLDWMREAGITGTLGGLLDAISMDAGVAIVQSAFASVRVELFRWDEGHRRGEFGIDLSREMCALFGQLEDELRAALKREQTTFDRQALTQIKKYLDGIVELFLQRA